MKIEVTEQHIKRGRGSCQFCPVALAIQQQTGWLSACVDSKGWIYPDHASAYKDKGQVIPEIQEFVRNFDTGATVQPFSFDLDTK